MKYTIAFLGPFLATLGASLSVTPATDRDWVVLLVGAASAGLGGLGAREYNSATKKRKHRRKKG